MKNLFYSITLLSLFGIQNSLNAQCEATASASSYEIYCGQSVDLTGFGQSSGTVILNEDFDGSAFGPGWGATPGATNFNNPCSPGGVDGTPHAWMDNNTSVPRTLVSSPYDLSASTAGVTICFDMLFAEQGDASPCEGPDESDEGVFLEYSIDGGTTWVTINYFDPNGGNDPQLTNWNNWCYQIPAAAITSSTQFRWHQTADSGADYDHWGIDNVAIYQNDINAELVWSHDGYSYGVGNPGGVNPNSVSPTTTTTYTVQLTTGDGTVCTDDVTIVVLDPVIETDIVLNPTSICPGECADFVGDASWVIDPGGIETYENNQTEIVATGSASVNINIQDLNMTTIDPGSIQEICINDFNYSGTQFCSNLGGCNCNGTPISIGTQCNLDASSFTITLTAPDGCEITLVPSGDLTTTGIQDMCFVPSGGNPLSSGSGNYSGQFDPTDPISGLDGCQANGEWTLDFDAGGGLGFGLGSLTGWKITFDDPPVEQPINHTWSPTTGLSDPSILTPEACPSATTTYTLEMDNGTPGCATQTENFTLTVSPCTGCTPPVLTINNIDVCSPNSADLNDAIDASSDPATITFHNTQADANNAANAIGNTVTTSGSYWVRAEDPLDPTCFDVFEIIVDVTTVTYSASATDENCGASDGEIVLTPSGGATPYSYSIDNGTTTQAGGTFSGLPSGNYDVVIEDANGCEVTGTENIGNIGGPTITSITTTDPTCVGACDGTIEVIVTGGTSPYTYQWLDNGGATIGTNAALITGLCEGDYSIEVNDAGGAACVVTDNATLTDPTPEDPTFTLTDFCEGAVNSATITGDAGGTFTFNPAPTDGATINSSTGEISNEVNGATYTVEYTTGGLCPESTTQTVSISGISYISNISGENCGANDGEIILTPAGGTAPYTYSIDNGTTSQGSGTFSGISAGVYNIVITDANGCSVSGSENVGNIGGPNIDQLINTNASCNGVCDGEISVVIVGGTSPYTYEWLDNSGTPIGANAADITGLCADSYSVRITDANGCIVTGNSVLTEPSPIDPSFALTDFCEGTANAATSIATAGGTFSFNPAVTDGTTINPSTGEISNGVGGTTYSVEYATAGTCSESSIETVNVVSAPVFTLTSTDPTCGNNDGSITLSGLNPSSAFDITYNDGSTVGPNGVTSNASGEIVLTSLNQGSYTDFEVEANGCSTIDNSTITLTEPGAPNIAAPSDFSVCVGESVTLTANNPDGATISWDNSVNDGVAFVTNTAGTFTYTVTGVLSGCTSTDQVVVTVNALPSVTAGNDEIICAGEIVTLSGGGALSYSWDNSVTNGTPFVPAGTNVYTVTGTDVNGCINTDQVEITVNPIPNPNFTGDQLTGCEPHTVNFTNSNTVNGGTCLWNFGDGTTGTTCDNITHTYNSSGVYDVTLTVSDVQGCSGTYTESNYIEVTPSPIADFTADPMVTGTNNPEVTFTNESINGADYIWNFGDNSPNVTSFNATHVYPDDKRGDYVVTLIASNGTDCSDTTSMIIRVEEELIFYVPNTFTPDESGYNDVFQPIFTSGFRADDFTLLIFNRWGEIVFESHDATIGWDGTYGGKIVKDGTYVWKIEFMVNSSDERKVRQGHVNLIR